MNPAEWVGSRTPPAPEELKAHMLRELGAGAQQGGGIGSGGGEGGEGRGGGDAVHADALVRATESTFSRVLDSGAASRESALDLLSADAFVTYAFEAAADEPATIPKRAEAAMSRISDLAAERLARETK